MRINLFTVFLLACVSAGLSARARDTEPYEQPPINYSAAQPQDPVARIQARFVAGEVKYGSTDRDLLLAEAEQLLIDRGVVQKGDLIVLTIGEPIGCSGGTNTLKIVRVGEHQIL